MRFFSGRLPNVSKKRNSIALFVGALVALGIIVLGKKYQPPVYPVQPLTPLTAEETATLLQEVLIPTIPEHLPLELAEPFIAEWNTRDFVRASGLEAAEQEVLLERFTVDPVDPIVPALVALAKRRQLLQSPPQAAQAIRDYLARYPTAGAKPPCDTNQPRNFEGYVCSQRQAFHRMVMQRTLFSAWFSNERERHQFGAIWKWAWWRTQATRRAGLFVHTKMDHSKYWATDNEPFQQDLKTHSGPEDKRTPAGIVALSASPVLLAEERVPTVFGSGTSAPFLPMESRVFPQQSLTCGPLMRTAQTQIVPFSDTDSQVLEMCQVALQRRAEAEATLQVKYARLLALRDQALHNKNMLQLRAWWNQRKVLSEVEAILDEMIDLEARPMPSFTLITFEDETPEEMGATLQAASDAIGTPPTQTLFALATYPGPEGNALSVTAAPTKPDTPKRWVLEAGTEQEGNVLQKGNVVYIDENATSLLGLETAKETAPDLWSRCFEIAQRDEPTTWCTEYQWLKISAVGTMPGRLYQITHGGIPTGGVRKIPWVPPGVLAFWGSAVTQDETSLIDVAVTGSAPVTLYDFMSGQPIDPTRDEWAYPSILADLR